MSLIKHSVFLFFSIFMGFMVIDAAEQSTPYILTDFPISLVPQDSAIWIKWIGVSRDESNKPDSGRIYFSRSPGGSVISNYTDSIVKRVVDTSYNEDDTIYTTQNNILDKSVDPPRRGIKFRPSENNMETGVYYVMVAWRIKIGLTDTAFFSNEIKVIIDADTAVVAKYPERADTIDNLTPTFQWDANPGVPYYHIIVSDEKITIDKDAETVDGLSIIWEAITSNTQFTYGAPDPSGSITADPPPLSPGKEYSWAVLNNFGNHPAYTSTSFSIPWSFVIEGKPLKAPVNTYPGTDDILSSTDNPTITFKWTNLDSLANTYKIYVYVTSDFEGVDAQMVVWSDEITSGSISGDTASASFNAKSILTSNNYTWKVIAVDDKGAGSIGEITGFKYNSPVGKLRVETKEKIPGIDTEKPVGLVEIQVDVLDGSLEAPLLFYTNENGILERDRPVGTYRLTAIKNEFETQSKTVTLTEGVTETTKFVLERPDATVFGIVKDNAGTVINLAQIIGVSEQGDTIIAESDPLGNFVMNCYEADWTIIAKKTGYISSLSRSVSVTFGQNLELTEPLTLTKNPYSLSGIVKNSSGEALIGVKVQLLRNGILIGEIPSTPQTGSFSFSVESGTYTVIATKTGFTSFNSTYDIMKSTQIDIALKSGAALITGSILGRSWNASFNEIFAPITNATVTIIDTTVTPHDTLSTTSDRIYGDFSLSVEGGKTLKLFSSANGFKADTTYKIIRTEGGKTHSITDTLYSIATIKGNIKISSSNGPADNVTVTVIDKASNTIISSSKSDALGTFEINNVPDNSNYGIIAGGIGLITDSLFLIDSANIRYAEDSIIVSDGLAKISSNNKIIYDISISMDYGSKALQWVLQHGSSNITEASIKVKSPVLKTIKPGNVLSGVGIGSYITVIDADSDSILDCSYHIFTIPASGDSIHTDTVSLPVVHHVSDSMSIGSNIITLTISTKNGAIDTGFVFYKDINGLNFDSIPYVSGSTAGNTTSYTFQVTPPRDGSYMIYYFKVYKDNDIYGYEQETFRTYISPDPSILTKITISPYSEDTLRFSANADITFSFNGYYGSNFLPVNDLAASNVTWSFINAQGCIFKDTQKNAIITTPLSGTNSNVVTLQAKFNADGRYRLAEGVSNPRIVYFTASQYALDSIAVIRVDADDRGYITTSPADKAEFIAQGIDAGNNMVTISPTWSIFPDSAGTINENRFIPNDNFIGNVRIFASSNNNTGEFNPQFGVNEYLAGLKVHYMVPMTLDTVESGVGCKIVIPPNLISEGEIGRISMERPMLKVNKLNIVSGNYNVIGDAYDIKELEGTKFRYDEGETTDSIIISIDIPEEYQRIAKVSEDKFYIALWNEDSVRWEAKSNSQIAPNGKSISTRTTHFSRYSLIQRVGETTADFSVKPNPFSPYVFPRAEYPEYSVNVPAGTCFEVSLSSKYELQFQIDIYNVVGSRVWSVKLNADHSEYWIWWNGKTTERTINLRTIDSKTGTIKTVFDNIPTTNIMCRNGRYFAVLTVKDPKKTNKYTKQVILFK